MDEKNSCDGRKTDWSCLDYHGANDIPGADSMIHVHDQNMVYYLNYGLVDKRLKDDLRDSFKNSIFEG